MLPAFAPFTLKDRIHLCNKAYDGGHWWSPGLPARQRPAANLAYTRAAAAEDARHTPAPPAATGGPWGAIADAIGRYHRPTKADRQP